MDPSSRPVGDRDSHLSLIARANELLESVHWHNHSGLN
jgi:hypothetical protein